MKEIPKQKIQLVFWSREDARTAAPLVIVQTTVLPHPHIHAFIQDVHKILINDGL